MDKRLAVNDLTWLF